MLEGVSVDRGGFWSDVQDGIRRCYKVVTHSVTMWRMSEFKRQQLDERSIGQFDMQNTCVVRWHNQLHRVVGTSVGNSSRNPSWNGKALTTFLLARSAQ